MDPSKPRGTFLKQYKYNVDMTSNRTQLQNMAKKENETFKGYAQRWREIATQVQPSLSKKELVTNFINTLQSPFYDRMIENLSSNFSYLVIIREKVEIGVRSGRSAQGGSSNKHKQTPHSHKQKKGRRNKCDPSSTTLSKERARKLGFRYPLPNTESRRGRRSQTFYDSNDKEYTTQLIFCLVESFYQYDSGVGSHSMNDSPVPHAPI
ncbi:hypothetical protein CR513_62336, partial [Mucuna pruriens]